MGSRRSHFSALLSHGWRQIQRKGLWDLSKSSRKRAIFRTSDTGEQTGRLHALLGSIPVTLVKFDVEDNASGEDASCHQRLPRDIAPANWQMKVSMTIGEALALSVHPNIVLQAETVMHVKMDRIRRKRRDLSDESVASAVEIELR